ncbi:MULTISPECIES: MmoB/DmpM family protein [Thermomonospora]|uniref:Monooxygenase component MmoB/DmpM n=1 Tax=Thermomonospora curvata (strain ATCC 19995 / DSM 43183 / JCM 3096 / KCTC 9072 / NBRC 15933 / NCIMB 10081 / Henssen B9) TaxID=471852 RepID=D1A3J7_THECD|nr:MULTISPECIES: MmoB/DmpM family protein [Thermomonospora]ACY96122.1 monooxygenase component MmoB/DmpM [Thermomonospora curvata DSM 43183]PKK15977.1 MAG: monooxygenase [Thermomonospora sp. CIF 1]
MTGTAPATGRPRTVGVDLQQNNEETRYVVEAIAKDNPDATIRHLPGLIKIQTPGTLVIRRETVEELLGRPWETHEFQLSIVSYYGHVDEWDDDQIVIKWSH